MGYEIERKFLIEYPKMEQLKIKEHVEVVSIIQTYLNAGINGENRRIRQWTVNEEIHYIQTEKQKISDLKRIENEWEISKEAYENLLKERDMKRNIIQKTRYRFIEHGFCYEVDVFPFWDDRAFLEVEMETETTQFPFPKEIKVIKEVTNDRRYTNHALAQKIPYDIF